MTVPHAVRPVRDGLLQYARRHRGMLVRGLLFTCLLVAARLALPLPLTQVVDRSTATAGDSGLASPVTLLSGAFVALALVAGMAEYHQRLAFAHFAGRTVSDARAQALANVQAGDDDGSVDRTAEVVGDSARIKQGLKGVLNHITVNGLLVLGVCVALAFVDVRLGLVQLAGAAVIAFTAVLGARRVAVGAAEHRRREIALAGAVHSLVAGERGGDSADAVSTVRAFDTESGAADIGMTRWEGLTTWAVHVELVATAAVVLVLGVRATLHAQMSTGTLFTVLAYLLVLHGPAVRFARQLTRIAPLLVSARQLGLVLLSASTPNVAANEPST
jgi:ABC-type multidrug transport system fused ATPase/permease subunit